MPHNQTPTTMLLIPHPAERRGDSYQEVYYFYEYNSHHPTSGVVGEVDEVATGAQRTTNLCLSLCDVPCEPVVVPEGGHAALPRDVVEVVSHH